MNFSEFLSISKFMPVCLPVCFLDLTIHLLINLFQGSSHIHPPNETLRSEDTISLINHLEISKVPPDCQNDSIISILCLEKISIGEIHKHSKYKHIILKTELHRTCLGLLKLCCDSIKCIKAMKASVFEKAYLLLAWVLIENYFQLFIFDRESLWMWYLCGADSLKKCHLRLTRCGWNGNHPIYS